MKDYHDNLYVMENQVALCSVENQYDKMEEILKRGLKIIGDKHDCKEYPFFLNNLYHVGFSSGKNDIIDYVFPRIEEYIDNVPNINLIPNEILDAVLYRYDILGNEKGVQKIIGFIKGCKPSSFDEYLALNDIILYYNKRHQNIKDIRSFLDEAQKVSAQMIHDEEERLIFKLNITSLYIEYDYKWQDMTIELFKKAEWYLKYSDKVAIAYIRMVVNVISDAFNKHGNLLNSIAEEDILTKALTLGAPCIKKYKDELFETEDVFIYKKREGFRFLMEYERMKSILNDYTSENYVRQVIESYKQIINLCKREGEKAECYHNIVVYIDEFITLDKGLQEERLEIPNENIYNIMVTERIRVTELFGELKEYLKECDHSKRVAYELLFTIHFCCCFGEKENALFYLRKFEILNIDIRNYTFRIQELYRNLKQYLN